MNKKLISILTSGILAVSMVGCSDNINKKDDTTNNVKQEQQIEKKNTNTNKDKVDTNKESTNNKEQTEKTNSNTEKNNTTKKVQQTKKKTTNKQEQQKEKNTNNEENDQICAICGEFVPVSDMCERNGKPVHYECIGAKKPGKAIEDEITPDDDSDEDAWINDDKQEFIKYTEDGNTEYYYNGHPVTEEEYNGRKGQFGDSDSINEKIIERNTQTQQDNNQSQQYNDKDDEEILK